MYGSSNTSEEWKSSDGGKIVYPQCKMNYIWYNIMY